MDQEEVNEIFANLFRFARKRSAFGLLGLTRKLYDHYHKLLARVERLEDRAVAAEEQLRRIKTET